MEKISEIEPKKIAVFRALQLGDMLCAIPAIRALKHAYPHSEITLFGLPWAENFVKRFSAYFTNFIHFPGYPGIIEQPFCEKEFFKFFQKVNNEEYDLIIQMHGNGSIVNPMINTLGAKLTAGYHEPGTCVFDKSLFMIYPENISEVERHLALMEFLGIPLRSKNLEFPVSREERYEFDQFCSTYNLISGEYICIHTGARDQRRKWASDKFSIAADAIAEKGYTIVFTGTEEEHEFIKGIEKMMAYPSINLAGKTNLGVLALLIRNSRMLLCNDTGVSHIAAAMETPSIVIFLASDPMRWAPLNQALHQIILPEQSGDIKFVLDKIKWILNSEGIYKEKSA